MTVNDVPELPCRFQLRRDGLYYIDPKEQEHKVTRLGICANGVRDLCIVQSSQRPGDINVAKIADADPQQILMVPEGDILWMNIDPPYGDRRSVILDIGDNPILKKMVKLTLQRFPDTKGSEYEMYGGLDYRNIET